MKFGKNKVIVCGSRGFTDYNFVKRHLDKILKDMDKRVSVFEIVSGYCPDSPDMLGERYATEVLGFKLGKGLRRFPAQWKVYGKPAGHIRNGEMAEYSTHCVAFWDGTSPGTQDMITQAERNNLVLREIKVDKSSSI